MTASAPLEVVVVFALLLPSLTASAEGFQSYEAGVQPIKTRIQSIDHLIAATHSRLAVPDISAEEKQLRLKCLKQYSAEKEQLEADLETGRKISELPGIMYFTDTDERLCSKDLNI